MSETLNVGDIFPAESSAALREKGVDFWDQRVSTVLGVFLYDLENEIGDEHHRWVSEDGITRITTHIGDNKITLIRRS